MIAVIAACAKNGVIGKNGQIPWHIPGEQKRFRELTMGNVVIMGRKTFEEIGKPLPGRTCIVISSLKRFHGVYTAQSLHEALRISGGKDVFIAGGEELYREAIPVAEKIFITEVDALVDGDKFFPQFDKREYEKKEEPWMGGKIPYRYITYELKAEERS